MNNTKFFIVIILLLPMVTAVTNDNSISSLVPFYHTTDDIISKIGDLASSLSSSSSVDVKWHEGRNGSSLSYLEIKSTRSNKNNEWAFIMFGEHGRELISSEVALRLVERIYYGSQPLEMSLIIVPVANPSARKEMEQDIRNSCQRVNANGVDLNRNYDWNWSLTSSRKKRRGDETWPGEYSFSEWETQSIRDIVLSSPEKRNIKLYINIHSGELGLYTPSDCLANEIPDNYKDMIRQLAAINAKYCLCKMGPSSKVAKYKACGTSTDWMHFGEPSVPYAYTFEIYDKKRASSQSDYSCFSTFNPIDLKHYERIVERWSDAIFYSLKRISSSSS